VKLSLMKFYAQITMLCRELERQYNTVCERNKWLETRIASLQREIDLLRDQNSLLQEQRNNAEREAAKLREEMKVEVCLLSCGFKCFSVLQCCMQEHRYV